MTRSIGQIGEDLAVKYLKKKDYQILERNFRKKWGELDIVCWDKKTQELVFVEVKTTQSSSSILPEESLTFLKKQKIKKAILSYLLKTKKEIKWRFDLISIIIFNLSPLKYEVNHYRNEEISFS
ncbi:MAG: YraN family protein [Candidatus Paceibacterota bacterium]